jgi:hypothetical protein
MEAGDDHEMAAEGAHVLRLVAGLGTLAAAAVVLAGCGGGGGQAEETKPASPGAKRLLASAPQKVANAGSSRMSFTYTVDTEALSKPITMTGEGAFDYARSEGRMSMDIGAFLTAAGKSGSGAVDVILTRDTYYLRYPLLSQALKSKKPWIKVDLADLLKPSGVDVSSLQLNQSDPSQTLVYLKATGKVEQEGTETIDGVETTKYHATTDLDRVPAEAPKRIRATVRASVSKLRDQYGISELPLDVWIDRQGLPRQLREEINVTAQGQALKVSSTVQFSDYGVGVHVARPPARQVIDISRLSG